MPWSPDEKAAYSNWSFEEKIAFREFCRANDLQDLKGVRFQRLVRLAHSEGLLSEILCRDKCPAEVKARGVSARGLNPITGMAIIQD